ncbi:MAG: hypothetical protein ACYCY2_06600 [Acidithiobacillus ferriphilus]|nr:hypothetical protein [Sulfuriferula sp.]
MPHTINESIIEDAALTWFGALSYAIGHGPHMVPGESTAERDSFGDVVLVGRMHGVPSVGITENLAQSAG